MTLKPSSLIILKWLLFGITVPFVVTRLYVQFYFRQHAWREIFTVAALLLFMANIVAQTESWLNSRPDSSSYADAGSWWARAVTVLKAQVVTMITYQTSVYAAKSLLLFLYLDITPKATFPKTRRAIILAWVAVIAGCLYTTVYELSTCRPFTDLITPGKEACWRHRWYFISSWSLHSVAELLVYGIPFVILRNLVQLGSIAPSDKRAAYWMIVAGTFNVACTFYLGVYNVLGVVCDRPLPHVYRDIYAVVGTVWQATTIQIVCLPQVRRFFRGLSAAALQRQSYQRKRDSHRRSRKATDLEAVPEVEAPRHGSDSDISATRV